MSVVIYFHSGLRRLRSPTLRSTHARRRATPTGSRRSECTPHGGHASSPLASTRVHDNLVKCRRAPLRFVSHAPLPFLRSRRMCTSRALAALRSGSPVNPERMADIALCALDRRPPSGAFSPRA
eukprot:2563631-Pleurochrysis_carterae.AAC.6